MNMSTGVFIATHCQGEVGDGNSAPQNTDLPSVTGTFTVGQTVTVSLGTWTGADSLAGSLRHVSDDTEIDTFTADGTYLLDDADFGEQLYLYVTATGAGGVASAESAATAAVGLPTADLLAWWYGGNGSTAEASVGVADGAAVSEWDDKTGTYNPANTGTNRPTYRQSVSGVDRGAVEFVAANSQYLVQNVASGILANLNVYNLHIVYKSTMTAIGAMYAEGSSISADPVVVSWLNNGAAGNGAALHRSAGGVGNSADLRGAASANNGNVHVLTLRRTAAGAWSLLVDGVEFDTDANSIGATAITRLAIGALVRTTVASYFTGHIFAIALYSTDSYATILPTLGVHYGVTMPPF